MVGRMVLVLYSVLYSLPLLEGPSPAQAQPSLANTFVIISLCCLPADHLAPTTHLQFITILFLFCLALKTFRYFGKEIS